MKRSLLFSAVLCAASLTSVHAAQPITEPEFASDIVDRYADHIFYGSGATGMALVVIDVTSASFVVMAKRDLVITFARSWIRSCVLLPSPN
ncbi:hypothetical protein [Shigella flexneri]|uniref:hypothetical protein n=1 Tax=Shigella flexneri TaxID=623 RepID=UPI0021170901|nr:hypothetical protein [Shigella flexneri]